MLLHGGTIHSPVSPFATAMLVDGDEVAWLGEDSAVPAHRDSADVVVDLHGALVTPGFVDAHVHTTSTGITLTGLDLSRCASLAEALALVEGTARSGAMVIGHGWDETAWPEGRPPSREEIDRASDGGFVYLSRIDVHSAVVSSGLLASVAPDLDGYDASGHLTRAAHHVVREAALGTIGDAQRERAQRGMRAHAASLGVVAMHEMAGPVISSDVDLRDLLALALAEPGPLVTGYWGELAERGGVDRARELGAIGVGGDLFVDGAIGSHTACLRSAYADEAQVGAQFLSDAQIAAHLDAAMHARLQAGFHVIGDQAMDAVIAGIRECVATHGVQRVREVGVRLEHAEMIDDGQVALLAEAGVIASVQPLFDALWGGSGGMYERRLGSERASRMNPFASMSAAGVLVAFGSDSPVTPVGPWAAMRAAMTHHRPAERMTARAAFSAHTRAGWRAVGQPQTGVLAPGSPAHYVIWECAELVVQTPDDRVAGWSTDPRSGTPGLPDLAPGLPLPRALRTVVAGATVHDTGELG